MTRLSQLIDERGTSIRQLAIESGIPERTVYRHASGETEPSLTQAAAYARALKVDLADLAEEPS